MRLVSIDELFWQDASHLLSILWCYLRHPIAIGISSCFIPFLSAGGGSCLFGVLPAAPRHGTHPSIPLWNVERIRRMSRCCAISPRMRYVNNMAARGERVIDKLGKKYPLFL